MAPQRFVCHSKTAIDIAIRYGWSPGARYTNLRDVRHLDRVVFIDINWQNYDYKRHQAVVRDTRPCFTVAQDVMNRANLPRILDQADELRKWACNVIVVPKDRSLGPEMEDLIPQRFILGFSVPSRYGGTRIATRHFRRKVHLLGGRPDVQRRLAAHMKVVSTDGNRFTLDAAFGDYFDGERFRPHPVGGYRRCLRDSVRAINRLWSDYPAHAHCCRCGATEGGN